MVNNQPKQSLADILEHSPEFLINRHIIGQYRQMVSRY